MSGTATTGNIIVPNYPVSNRVPGFYAGIDASGANSGTQSIRTLLIGQANAQTPAAILNEPVLSLGTGNAQALYGGNSPLAQMVAWYRLRDSFGELWELPIPSSGAGTPSTGGIAITAAASGDGTLFLMIGGVLIEVTVNQGDTPTTIATNVYEAILQADETILVAPTISASTVTLTSTFSGSTANDISVLLNYLGAAGGQSTPAGVGVTITPMSGGTGEQPIAAALANLPDLSFDFIVCSQNDLTTIAAITAFLNDATGRWSWSYQLFGHAIYGKWGSLGALAAFGNSLNDQHATVVGLYASPTPSFLMAANIAAVAAVSVRADPAVPIQNIATDILQPPLPLQFQISERNTLLYDGIATVNVQDDGTVNVERLITTYQTNAAGVADNSYLDIETLNSLTYVIRDLRTYIVGLYGSGSKIVSSTSRVATGTNTASTTTIAQSFVNRYTYLQNTVSIVQNADVFAAALDVQDQGNGLVVAKLPIDLANQLRIIAVDIAFTKT